jgi:hypothetical protein
VAKHREPGAVDKPTRAWQYRLKVARMAADAAKAAGK